MGRRHAQAASFKVIVVGCQIPTAKDGDSVFLQWKRGMKDKNSGSSESLVVSDGTTQQNFEPITLNCTLVKESLSAKEWETKYLSLSLKLTSAKANEKKGKKGKEVKSKLVGKTIINLADYGESGASSLKHISLKSKNSKATLNVRFETSFMDMEEFAEEDRSFIQTVGDDGDDDQKTEEVTDVTIMGTEMDEMTETESPPEPGSFVPAIVADSIRFLEENSLKTEGLFRISGVKSEMTKILEVYNAGFGVDLSKVSQHSVSNALKLYLRSMHDPLLTYELYDEWMQVAGKPEVSTIEPLLKKLPPANNEILGFLCHFLKKVGTFSEENKMTDDNLALVFAPSLIWSSDPLLDPNHLMRDTFLSKALVLEMITQYSKLFPEVIEVTGFSEREELTFEEYSQRMNDQEKKRKKERKKLDRRGSVLMDKDAMKKLRGGSHYSQNKYLLQFNILSITKIPGRFGNHPVCLKWDKRGDPSKSGSTPSVQLKPEIESNLHTAQFTQSEMAEVTLRGKKPNVETDAPFANHMKVTFFQSQKTSNMIKKPLKLILAHPSSGHLDDSVIAEGIWDLAEVVKETKSHYRTLDLFCKDEETLCFTVHIHMSLSYLANEAPARTRLRSMSISLSSRRGSVGGDREKKKEKEKEKEKGRSQKIFNFRTPIFQQLFRFQDPTSSICQFCHFYRISFCSFFLDINNWS
mmetsp:Transcript_1854/g.2516  ORF Transcript_1854/g.2516 Transcript_1854/m.2516 type:complete len:694 (-) Transcript_1854:536-2617(-)